jgi:hypothetical protein
MSGGLHLDNVLLAVHIDRGLEPPAPCPPGPWQRAVVDAAFGTCDPWRGEGEGPPLSDSGTELYVQLLNSLLKDPGPAALESLFLLGGARAGEAAITRLCEERVLELLDKGAQFPARAVRIDPALRRRPR